MSDVTCENCQQLAIFKWEDNGLIFCSINCCHEYAGAKKIKRSISWWLAKQRKIQRVYTPGLSRKS